MFFFFFFFKQKTAYEMRISDWSSDVCSSDLVGMALHHKICHTLGGLCDLPHAETHSIILPHAMAYNHVATDAMARIARALGVEGNAAVAMPGAARFCGSFAIVLSLMAVIENLLDRHFEQPRELEGERQRRVVFPR